MVDRLQGGVEDVILLQGEGEAGTDVPLAEARPPGALQPAQATWALRFIHSHSVVPWLGGVDTVISVVQGQELKVGGTQGRPAADTPVPPSPGGTPSGRSPQGNIRRLKLTLPKEMVLPACGEETAE